MRPAVVLGGREAQGRALEAPARKQRGQKFILGVKMGLNERIPGAILGPKSFKIDAKIDARINAKKTWKFMKFQPKIFPKSRSRCIEKPDFSVQLIFRKQRL